MELIDELRSIVGHNGVLDAATLSERSAGFMRTDKLQAMLLVRPANTEEVSRVMRSCHRRGIPVVAQGGLTGLVHGADAGPGEVILSLERMRGIGQIDSVQRTAVVQAGVTLQALQEAVEAQDLAFPLDLGARGSATLGGIAATNAGGNRVLRYGMAREMILGLEVVLADGTVVSAMNHLLKNNTGYDLKHWFIGSEGTLGVITRLVLRLRERPKSQDVALVGAPSFEAVTQLLKHMDASLGGKLSAFEVMWPDFYHLVTTPPAKGLPPLSSEHAFYVLIESQGADAVVDTACFADALGAAMDRQWVADAVIAQSQAERHALWALRDDVGQVMNGGAPVVFDISLPLSRMQSYTQQLGQSLRCGIGEHKLWLFGHLGDGNLHVIVQVKPQDYMRLRPRVETLVYQPLAEIGGSVSAEHGIGLEKRPWLSVSRSHTEIELMRRLRAALDPCGMLNAGKLMGREPAAS
ncbi:FAD-binding oxidoreductase [Methylibium sp.]|uniref:FAD-binding oxidoreductase n=1 Tax=Methylibium sp. TaxID=2067992 RepID=UPI003D10C9C3